MKSKTPRADAFQIKMGIELDDIIWEDALQQSLDFARQLEEENLAMRQAISTAVDCIEGLDLHLSGNYGMFVLAALDKLQPFSK